MTSEEIRREAERRAYRRVTDRALRCARLGHDLPTMADLFRAIAEETGGPGPETLDARRDPRDPRSVQARPGEDYWTWHMRAQDIHLATGGDHGQA